MRNMDALKPLTVLRQVNSVLDALDKRALKNAHLKGTFIYCVTFTGFLLRGYLLA